MKAFNTNRLNDNFKGCFYQSTEQREYYEGGAHFKASELTQCLKKISQEYPYCYNNNTRSITEPNKSKGCINDKIHHNHMKSLITKDSTIHNEKTIQVKPMTQGNFPILKRNDMTNKPQSRQYKVPIKDIKSLLTIRKKDDKHLQSFCPKKITDNRNYHEINKTMMNNTGNSFVIKNDLGFKKKHKTDTTHYENQLGKDHYMTVNTEASLCKHDKSFLIANLKIGLLHPINLKKKGYKPLPQLMKCIPKKPITM